MNRPEECQVLLSIGCAALKSQSGAKAKGNQRTDRERLCSQKVNQLDKLNTTEHNLLDHDVIPGTFEV